MYEKTLIFDLYEYSRRSKKRDNGRMKMNGKLLIFDLDNTLYPAEQLSDDTGQPLIELLISYYGPSNLAEVYKIYDDLKMLSFEFTAKKYAFPAFLKNKLANVFDKMEVISGLKLFEDTKCIAGIENVKVLVTTGYERLQKSKIRLLGIEKMFKEIIIDDPRQNCGKKAIFAKLQRKYDKKPEDIIVIGDNPEAELKAGKELGMITVQYLRPNMKYAASAEYHIKSYRELTEILEEFPVAS